LRRIQQWGEAISYSFPKDMIKRLPRRFFNKGAPRKSDNNTAPYLEAVLFVKLILLVASLLITLNILGVRKRVTFLFVLCA